MRRPVYPPAPIFSAGDIPAAAIIVAWTRNGAAIEASNANEMGKNGIKDQ
jgi:hypothetical protein